MTKALLSERGVEFDVLDVENDPAALDQLLELGLRTVPVVALGERHVSGWNPTKVSELLGLEYRERETPAEELLSSIRTITDAALRAVRQVPDDRLGMRSPDRDRPLRQLAHHLFRVVETGVDADVLGVFPAQEWLKAADVPAHTSSARIARYGEAVKAKLNAWYDRVDQAAFDRTIDADVGERTLTQVLERTRLHSGQHLRQIYAFLEMSGVQPEDPLTLEEMRRMGMSLPDDVF